MYAVTGETTTDLSQLLKAQQKTNSDLEEARNARYAKEGEVSILRKSIEKVRVGCY